MTDRHRIRLALAAVLGAVLLLSIAALAGSGLAAPGKGKPGKGQRASTAQYQYGPSGKQYGKNKVAVCHKGKKTLRLPAPAVKAHLRHGDSLGACP